MQNALSIGLLAVTIVLVLLDVAVVSAWMRFNRWRHERFKYRVRMPGEDGTQVALGAQWADGKITARGLELIDGMDRRVAVADGQLFTIEMYDGGARGDDGTYRVPSGSRAWVLDYEPAMPEAAPTLPSRAEPYVLTTCDRPLVDEVPRSGRFRWWLYPPFIAACVARAGDYRFAHDEPVLQGLVVLGIVAALARAVQLARVPQAPEMAVEPNEHGSVTLVSLPAPLWVHGFRKAQNWFLPAKPPDDSTVMIVAPFDPDYDDTDEPRTPLLGAAHHMLAEAIEIGTDVHARAIVPVVQTRARRYLRRLKKNGYAAFVPWIRNYPGRRLLIWSTAAPNPEREGFTLHAKATEPPDAPEHEMSGTIDVLVPRLLEWLEQNQWCKRVPRVDGVAPSVPAEDHAAWAALLAMQERVALGKPESALLPPPEGAWAARALDAAIEFAERRGGDVPQANALALSMGVEVQKHGVLDESRREKLRAIVASLEAADHPLARMAPGMLTGIGDLATGAANARERLAARGGAMRGIADGYSEWLGEIAAKPEALVQKKKLS